MDDNENKVIDKIEKLLALSSSSNENEARAESAKSIIRPGAGYAESGK